MPELSLGAGWRQALFFLAALLVIIADQLTKAWIRANVPEGATLVDFGFLRIVDIRNTGAAFGMFPQASLILMAVSLIATMFLLAYAIAIYRYIPLFNSLWGWLTLGLILGGTVGNLIDRFRFGNVTDFIDFKVWPAFNVADASVSVGVAILAIYLLRLAGTEKHQDGQDM